MTARNKRWPYATWRVWAVVGAIGIGSIVVTLRLIQLQILDHEQYAQEARMTHISQITTNDRRGALLDRNGYPLAASEDAYNIMVERDRWLSDPELAASSSAELSKISGVPAEEMVSIVNTVDVFEVPVAKGLTHDQATAVRELGLLGVRLLDAARRVYPEGNLAAQLMGFVGQDHTGLTGVEIDLDDVLGGDAGSITYERDGLGRELPNGERSEIPSLPGSNVVLTIDRYIQRLAEEEVDRAIKEHKAQGGTIIVIQPKTGEILAMATRPTIDLTKPGISDESKVALSRNRAITDTYEPGSVFKLFTMAAALDAGLVSPGGWWYDSGELTLDGWTIKNWDFSANGSQTVQQILSKSLNTGAAWLASLCGPERFYQYVHSFGFGSTTASGLSGEVDGRVRTPGNDPENWRAVDMATNSFGQGLAATPLQVAMALAAIANNGMLMKPQFVKEIAGPLGTEVVEPQQVRQVITPESARTLLDMMGVVVDGVSPAYLNVQGYDVGGKTGTANVATDVGGYKPDAYISSFAGVAPIDDPQIAVLVKIDEPKDVPWGTVVAAPSFGRIAEKALAYMNVPPNAPALVQDLP
jgi:cell division protein FtsI/penicillin-binding protein 2